MDNKIEAPDSEKIKYIESKLSELIGILKQKNIIDDSFSFCMYDKQIELINKAIVEYLKPLNDPSSAEHNNQN
jgi:hypothetical protein